jgi:hypothetical protein
MTAIERRHGISRHDRDLPGTILTCQALVKEWLRGVRGLVASFGCRIPEPRP